MTSPEAGRMLAAAVEYFAAQGVEDRSLRSIAAGIGTSHRMVIYHFGSRDGLLAAVVDVVEARQRDLLVEVTAAIEAGGDPRVVLLEFWARVVEAGRVHGPLFFELSVHAMRDQPHARAWRESLVEPWIDALTVLLGRLLPDTEPHRADDATRRTQARLGLAVARGLLHDVLVTGEVDAATEAMSVWIDLVTGTSAQ